MTELARHAQVIAQAKVNPLLRILAREDTGYHQIETLLLRIALADIVRIRRTPRERSLDVTGDVDLSALGPVDKNLAWRAALAFAEDGRWTGGFAIEIEKHIPIGGGLGGGSADAGGVIRTMNAMSGRSVNPAAIAAGIGADVAFLASEAAYALAWGRGERMVALTAPPVRDVVLMLPAFGVNTAEAYGWTDAHPIRLAKGEVFDHEALSTWQEIAGYSANDFEPAVSARHPEILRMMLTLATPDTLLVRMSGSGSTVFAVFGTMEAANEVAQSIRNEGVRVIHTRTASHVEPVQIIE